MSIQSIPPGPPTTAGQLAARATQNDQILAAAIAETEDRVSDLESRSGTSVFSGMVSTFADLPDPADRDGEAWVVLYENDGTTPDPRMYVSNGSPEWGGPVSIEGAATAAAVAAVLGEPVVRDAAGPVIDARTGSGQRPIGRDEEQINARHHGFLPTNDPATNATNLRAAANLSVAENLPFYIGPGHYEATSFDNRVFLPPDTKWTWRGEGATIKVPDGSMTANGQRMIYLYPTAGAVESVTISGMAFDGNRRTNIPPTDYGWEHNAIIATGRNAPNRIKHIVMQDLVFDDPVADCIYINNWGHDTLRIDGIVVKSRSGTRSDIIFSGFPQKSQISNFIGDSIESEPIDVPLDIINDFLVQMNNVQCSHRMDLGAGRGANVRWHITNADAHGFTLINGAGFMHDSRLTFNVDSFNQRRIRWPQGFVFDNVDFYLESDAAGVIAPVWVDGRTPDAHDVTFRNCRFHVMPHPDYTGSTFTGPALLIGALPGDGVSRTHLVENCWFDPRFAQSVRVDRGATVRLRRNTYGGTAHAIDINYTAGPFRSDVTVEGGNWDAVTTGVFMRLSGAADALGTLRLRDIETGKSGFSAAGLSGLLASPHFSMSSTRIVLAAGSPTGGAIVGDRWRTTTPANGQPVEWVATTTGGTSATWRVAQTLA